jgi:hypothetical protein
MTQGTRRLFILISAGMAAVTLGAGAIRPVPARAATAITFNGSPGTGAPPPTLGLYTMLPFGSDPQPLTTAVSGVTGPTGQVGFTPALLHLHVSDWARYQVQGSGWSNRYTGDLYYTGTLSNLQGTSLGARSMTFTLPAGTNAFYFYAVPRIPATQDQPCPSPFFTMSATAQDGTTSGSIPVSGCSALRVHLDPGLRSGITRHWGYSADRTTADQLPAKVEPLAGGPGSVGGRRLRAAEVGLAWAADRPRGRGSAPGHGRQRVRGRGRRPCRGCLIVGG